MLYLDAFATLPGGSFGKVRCKVAGERGQAFCGKVFFVPRRLNEQRFALPVVLEIDATNNLAVVQNRQRVVAKDALWLWRINLDAVVKIPKPLVAFAKPNQRIKRTKQRCAFTGRGLGKHLVDI